MTKLWAHQEGAADYAEENDSCLLHMHMGTGKTLTTLEVIKRKGHKLILILCPKAVIRVWGKESEKHFPTEFNVHLLDKSAKRVKELLALLKNTGGKDSKPLILVTNYEAMRSKPFRTTVLQHHWDCLVLDESHRIKSPNGNTSKAVSKISATQKIGLTGTPMPHSPLDIFGQYRTLDVSIFGKFWTPFKAQYAVMGGPEGRWIQGTKNHDQLAQKMNKIRYEVTQDALDLPPIQIIDRTFPLENKGQKHYAEMENLFITEIKGQEIAAANALVKMLRLQQITSGFLPTEDPRGDIQSDHICSAKSEQCLDIAEDIGVKQPLVVFVKFVADIARLEKAFTKMGRTVGQLSGARKDMDAWDDEEIDTLIVQIGAGAEGIDLTRARYAVYYSMGFSLGQYEQSLARLHRPGQKHPVTIYRLGAEGTIDVKIFKALKKRGTVRDDVMSKTDLAGSIMEEMLDACPF